MGHSSDPFGIRDDAAGPSQAALRDDYGHRDRVHHPAHYNLDPSGIECITIVRHRNFNIGNAIKYLWRAGLKAESGDSKIKKHIEDLRKAIFYINDEIARLEKEAEREAQV